MNRTDSTYTRTLHISLDTDRKDKSLYTDGDQRLNLNEITSPTFNEDFIETIQQQAQSIACLIHKNYLIEINDGWQLHPSTMTLSKRVIHELGLQNVSFGEQEAFKDQLAPGFGTAFLIGKKLVLTAAHCVCIKNTGIIDNALIQQARLVFGFHEVKSKPSEYFFSKKQVYRIERVVRHEYLRTEDKNGEYIDWNDWALLELNDEVPSTPLSINVTGKIAEKIELYMLGHPNGLPLKFTGNGFVTGVLHKDFFECNLDAFGGNSGSFIAGKTTCVGIGILSGGVADYEITNNYKNSGETRIQAVHITEKQILQNMIGWRYENCQRLHFLRTIDNHSLIQELLKTSESTSELIGALKSKYSTFSVKQCYHELVLLKKNKGEGSHRLFEEHRVNSCEDIQCEKEPIDLDQMFKKKKERILILGRAGIGKSTLCEHIAHQWAQGKLWDDRFDALFLVPLRNLQHLTVTSASSFLFQLCCQEHSQNLHANDLENYLEVNKKRILFVIDGLDEISLEDPRQSKVVFQLLSYPHWIVASRPHVTPSISPHATIENVGFSSTTIDDYIRKSFPEQATSVLEKLHQNKIIYGLCHIPVNLTLVLSILEKSQDKIFTIHSMTDLYKQFTLMLQRRFLEKIGKASPWEWEQGDIERDLSVKHVFDLLEIIAWTGLKEGILIFGFNENFKEMHEIYCKQPPSKERKELFEKICKSGFIHATGQAQEFLQNEYSFLHLTFQEFFAARWLAKLLEKEPKVAEPLIHEIKLDPRYKVVIWFIAGLLKNNVKTLNLLFDILNTSEETRGFDLAMLKVRCLEEVHWAPNLNKIQVYKEEISARCNQALALSPMEPSLSETFVISSQGVQNILFPVLMNSALSSSDQVQQNTFSLLGQFGSLHLKKTLSLIEKAFASSNWEVKQRAVEAFIKLIKSDPDTGFCFLEKLKEKQEMRRCIDLFIEHFLEYENLHINERVMEFSQTLTTAKDVLIHDLYGNEVQDINIRKQAESIACIVHKDMLVQTKFGWRINSKCFRTVAQNIETMFHGIPFGEKESFRNELMLGYGTAFLVGPRLIMTIGSAYLQNKIIFGFYDKTIKPGHFFSKNQVYQIQREVAHEFIETPTRAGPPKHSKWTLLELDRDVPFPPLKLNMSTKIASKIDIYMLGHPLGTSLKLFPEASIKSVQNGFFECDLQSFVGNGGSPVFNRVTHEVEGILCSGREDYEVTDDYLGTGERRIQRFQRTKIEIYSRKIGDRYDNCQRIDSLRFLLDDGLLGLNEKDRLPNASENIVFSLQESYKIRNKIPRPLGNSIPIEEITELTLHFKESPVQLSTIFDKKEDITPKRIHILGGTGSGKTTLCQYIAHQWAQGKLWTEKFDAIFWISLQELQCLQSVKTIPTLLYRLCCREKNEKLYPKDIKDYLKHNKERILIVLDNDVELTVNELKPSPMLLEEAKNFIKETHKNLKNMDEIQFKELQELKQKLQIAKNLVVKMPSDPEDLQLKVNLAVTCVQNRLNDLRPFDDFKPADEFISDLVELPYWIMTSSPHSMPYLSSDLTIQIKGFSQEAQKQYLDKVMPNGVEISKQMLIGCHNPLILSTISSLMRRKGSPLSTPELFQKLILTLQRYYLEKIGNPDAWQWEEEYLECDPEVSLIFKTLESLGWEGIKRNGFLLSFNQYTIKNICLNNDFSSKKQEPLFKNICASGFLQPSEENSTFLNKEDYSFLHLTFQDFFGARFLARLFEENPTKATKCIQELQLNHRYEIVMGFVKVLLKYNHNFLELLPKLSTLVKKKEGLNFGIEFDALEDFETYPLTKDDHYGSIIPGLNLKGQCDNQECKAQGKIIWFQKGMGNFNIPEEVFNQECPKCFKSIAKVDSLGFFKCAYRIEGLQATPIKQKIEKKNKTNFFVVPVNNKIHWVALKIMTEEDPELTKKESKKEGVCKQQ